MILYTFEMADVIYLQVCMVKKLQQSSSHSSSVKVWILTWKKLMLKCY